MGTKKLLKKNKGVCWERVNYVYNDGRTNFEKVFQEKWDEENRPRPGINSGFGAAQDLFIVGKKAADLFDGPDRDDRRTCRQTDLFEPEPNFGQNYCVYKLTEREHRIIATIIQWFGSNVGFSFLQGCIESCGYRLDRVPRIVSKKEGIVVREKASRYWILKNSGGCK